ncbi:MAG: hypothetical protein BV459_01930, partial [Thermoplasmata archaeon M11B2D]
MADVVELREAFRIVRQIWAMAAPATEQLQMLMATGISMEGKNLTDVQKKSLEDMIKSYENFFKEMAHVWGQLDDVESSKLSNIGEIVDKTVTKINDAILALEGLLEDFKSQVGMKNIREILKSVRELRSNLIGEAEEQKEEGRGRKMPIIKRWLEHYFKQAVEAMKVEGVNIDKVEVSGIRGTTLFKNINEKMAGLFDVFVKTEMDKIKDKINEWLRLIVESSKETRTEEIKILSDAIDEVRKLITEVVEDPEKLSKSLEVISKLVKGDIFDEFFKKTERFDPDALQEKIRDDFRKFMEQTFSTETIDRLFKLDLGAKKVKSIIGGTAKAIQNILRETFMELVGKIGRGEEIKITSTAPDIQGMADFMKEVREFMEKKMEMEKDLEELVEEIHEWTSAMLDDIGDMAKKTKEPSSNEVADSTAEMPQLAEVFENIRKMTAPPKITKKMIEETIRGLPVTRITTLRTDIVTTKEKYAREVKKILDAVRGMKMSIDNQKEKLEPIVKFLD